VCRDLAPADRERFVVVGRKFVAPGNEWEVLRLSTNGTLARTGVVFAMGESTDARTVFTPDGRVGVAVQDDGTIGIFEIAEDGTVTVIDAGFGGGDRFYANFVRMAPDGSHVVVGDGNTTENGGGLYRVDLDCTTGAPTYVGLLADVNNAWAGTPLGDARWIVGSNGGALGVEDGTDVQDLRVGETWTLIDGVETSPEPAAFNALEAARDGSFVLAADAGLFSENEVTLVSVQADGLTTGGSIAAAAPYDVAIAPEGDVALVSALEDDALFVVDVEGDQLSIRGELAYAGPGSLLPAKMGVIERGGLDGLVLVAELYGVRVVSFDGGGVVTDHGLTYTGGDNQESAQTPVGIGVQP
jgi:hypothetical protein